MGLGAWFHAGRRCVGLLARWRRGGAWRRLVLALLARPRRLGLGEQDGGIGREGREHERGQDRPGEQQISGVFHRKPRFKMDQWSS
jgi:hypothetical protein